MADHGFDGELHRMFAEAPALPDAGVFAARVEAKLERGWRLRRTMIGGAGLLGGTIAVAQLVTANLGDRLGAASHQSLTAAREALAQLPVPGGPQLETLREVPFGAEAVWLVLGLAVLAAALFASRSVEEL
jgi:hypothetical protein